ncbi:TetR/AcrR family transcriptional regulator [Bacillus sp. B15-48]|uniref:TetR/AcrR family transcriptional regulator n=1 Tax=Bacillus sp. B15-48 TaxID=1548601 RepID=UPI00193EE38C|nr:TetR/AcrR family transcriptional regulator [Bacillus sp. B15-48]MBM4760951.1 TetR family transcriptional regulator [Bacillus sp. B15-48]
MNEKKLKLIQSGLKLFASKGYHRTSIQEITAEAGVSKGTFYVYFESKEEYMLTAYQSFYDQTKAKVEKVKSESLPPRENFAMQMTVWLKYVYDYKDFLVMHFEENITIGENASELVKQIKVETYQWMRENIENIYGASAIEPYIVDTIIQLDGLLNGYLRWMIVDDVNIDIEKIGSFLVRRLDNLVDGMQKQQEEPLVTLNHIPEKYEKATEGTNQFETFALLRRKIATQPISREKQDQLQEVVDLLEKEARKEERQPVIIQGLLAHFHDLSELQAECKKLAEILHVELLK